MDMSKFKEILEKFEQEESKEQNKTAEGTQRKDDQKNIEQSTPSQSIDIDQRHTVCNRSSGYRSDSYNYVGFIYDLRTTYKSLPLVQNLHMPKVSERIAAILRMEGYTILRPKNHADRTIYQLPNLDIYVECDDGYRYFADNDNNDLLKDCNVIYQPESSGDDTTSKPLIINNDGTEKFWKEMADKYGKRAFLDTNTSKSKFQPDNIKPNCKHSIEE